MAPNENVTADEAKIKSLAASFLQWSQDVDLLLPDVSDRKITPGCVPYGQDLKTRYKDRVPGEYLTLLKNLQKSLLDVSRELTKVADGYKSTENKNLDDLGRLGGLIGAVQKTYAVPPPSAPSGKG